MSSHIRYRKHKIYILERNIISIVLVICYNMCNIKGTKQTDIIVPVELLSSSNHSRIEEIEKFRHWIRPSREKKTRIRPSRKSPLLMAWPLVEKFFLRLPYIISTATWAVLNLYINSANSGYCGPSEYERLFRKFFPDSSPQLAQRIATFYVTIFLSLLVH